MGSGLMPFCKAFQNCLKPDPIEPLGDLAWCELHQSEQRSLALFAVPTTAFGSLQHGAGKETMR